MIGLDAEPLPSALEYMPSDASRSALREMRMRYVQQQALLGVVVNLALSTLILVVWWPFGNHAALITWYAALALIGLLRLVQRTQFFAAAAPTALKQFEQRFCAMIC